MWYAALIALLTALPGTWLLIHFAPQLQLIDKPNARSSHQAPTPRGGGLAIVSSILLAALLATTPATRAWWPPLLAALPIALIGLLDDRYGMSAAVRLAVQLVSAAAFMLWVDDGRDGAVNTAVMLMAILAIAWASNLFNFMDGIDGIAGAQALFMGLAGGWLLQPENPTLAALLWITAAASAGFLVWNWSPARIFMGDVGSAFLGFLIAAVAAESIVAGELSLPVWLILWSVFLADSGVTLARRVLRGERWWTAHRSHAYQQLSRKLNSHARASTACAAVNLLVALPAAWLARSYPAAGWTIAGTVLALFCVTAATLNAGRDP
jgi:Fuc2NAc and GlcNAc transferase